MSILVTIMVIGSLLTLAALIVFICHDAANNPDDLGCWSDVDAKNQEGLSDE